MSHLGLIKVVLFSPWLPRLGVMLPGRTRWESINLDDPIDVGLSISDGMVFTNHPIRTIINKEGTSFGDTSFLDKPMYVSVTKLMYVDVDHHCCVIFRVDEFFLPKQLGNSFSYNSCSRGWVMSGLYWTIR